jgi:hypothetical protein
VKSTHNRQIKKHAVPGKQSVQTRLKCRSCVKIYIAAPGFTQFTPKLMLLDAPLFSGARTAIRSLRHQKKLVKRNQTQSCKNKI